MKKGITLFITVLFLAFGLNSINAQPNQITNIQNTLKNGKDNMKIDEIFALMNIDRDKFFNEKKINRGQVYYIRDYEYFKKLSFSTMWFDFLLLVDNDDNLLYSTVQISGIKSPEFSNNFQQYHTSFANYQQLHEEFYGISIDLSDENMSPLNDYAFGTGCGWGESVPTKGREMFEMVKNEDVEGLVRWTRSMNPSIQAYGVMGLYFIEKNGGRVKLTRKDKKIIEYIKSKPTVIDYCSNIELNSTTPMNRVLSDFYLDNIWKLYKDSKYLR